MSYDYSSESQRLELPNPYRLQNQLLWLCAALLMSAGITSLWWTREALQAQNLKLAAIPLIAGLIIVSASLTCAATAATRLRFFFGRGRPNSLTHQNSEVPPGQTGTAMGAAPYKEVLRQGALSYPEPNSNDPIAGLLYHWAPRLITAPVHVQHLTKVHFFNLVWLLATTLSFLFSWGIFGTPQTRDWVGILYFSFVFYRLLQPVLSHEPATLSRKWLIGLIASAVLAPVLIGLLAPRLPHLGLNLNTQTVVMLLTAIVACALGLVAALSQIDETPTTQTSTEQRTLSMNAPPAMLLGELDRILQSEWTERIPNRRYSRIEPVTSASTRSGSFSGELFEETQPLPVSGTTAPTFGSALSGRKHRTLLLLDIYATLLFMVSAGFALFFVHEFDALLGWENNRFSQMGVSVILGLVALLCFRISGDLWGRFNFESTLIWVEVIGNYQTSSVGTGNQLSSQLNTQNEVIRTESMTLRVWRARIESVVFGKNASRHITAMFSTDREAQHLTDRLTQFAQNQSVLVATNSTEDLARMAALGRGENALLAQRNSTPQQLGAQQLPSALTDHSATTPGSPQFCIACGTKAATGAKFCSHCGQTLVKAA